MNETEADETEGYTPNASTRIRGPVIQAWFWEVELPRADANFNYTAPMDMSSVTLELGPFFVWLKQGGWPKKPDTLDDIIAAFQYWFRQQPNSAPNIMLAARDYLMALFGSSTRAELYRMFGYSEKDPDGIFFEPLLAEIADDMHKLRATQIGPLEAVAHRMLHDEEKTRIGLLVNKRVRTVRYIYTIVNVHKWTRMMLIEDLNDFDIQKDQEYQDKLNALQKEKDEKARKKAEKKALRELLESMYKEYMKQHKSTTTTASLPKSRARGGWATKKQRVMIKNKRPRSWGGIDQPGMSVELIPMGDIGAVELRKKPLKKKLAKRKT